MISMLKQMPRSLSGSVLNRLMLWSAGLLVLAVGVFAVYYYLDQSSRERGTSIEREITRYEEAVRADPTDLSARMALAQLYYAHGRYEESAEQYQEALTIDEENAVALVGYGRSALAAGDEAGAIGTFQKVLDLAADAEFTSDVVGIAHYYLGSAYLAQQQTDDAIAHLEQVLAIERTDADAWYLLGVAYLQGGDVDEAITALSEAVRFVPNFAEAYEQLALAYEQKGMVAEGHYARGMLAFSNENYSDAESELLAALDIAPTFTEAHVGLGMVRESQGQRDLAVSSYHTALQLDGDNFNARAGLARLGASIPASTAEEGVAP